MKTLKLFITLIALIFTVNVSFANEDPVKPSTQLRSELMDLIGTNSSFDMESDVTTAEVIFTVNKAGEVIVISVISDDERAVKHIKSKINYKKVTHRTTKPGEMYLLPVRIVKS
jgi:hypothetical protein